MIEIIFHTDSAFVYNANGWETLRKVHRIVGELFGQTKFIPTLPIKLTPEETVLLVKKGIAKLVEYKQIKSAPPEENKQKVTQFTAELIKEERKVYLEVRKQELENTIDKIVTGKRKRGDETPVKDILTAELKKSGAAVTKETMIWPIFTEHALEFKGECSEVLLDPIVKQTTSLKCAVYQDLWEKGHYVTTGEKFGGDFLVYLGDPIAFHAVYIVRCLEDPKAKLSPSELVAFGRLGTSVKKKAIFASMGDNETVSYITINWMDT